MKIKENIQKIKEKYMGFDKSLSRNWSHILGPNACIRKTSRGIKIEYQKKKD